MTSTADTLFSAAWRLIFPINAADRSGTNDGRLTQRRPEQDEHFEFLRLRSPSHTQASNA
jgi:hypothetical protein